MIAVSVQCCVIVPSLVTRTLKEVTLVRVLVNQRVDVSTTLHREPITLELARHCTLARLMWKYTCLTIGEGNCKIKGDRQIRNSYSFQ